jgi:hypothetical protein
MDIRQIIDVVSKQTSRIAWANEKSGSIRATIPRKIAEDLGLKVEDTIEWESYIEKGRKFARFRKLE